MPFVEFETLVGEVLESASLLDFDLPLGGESLHFVLSEWSTLPFAFVYVDSEYAEGSYESFFLSVVEEEMSSDGDESSAMR